MKTTMLITMLLITAVAGKAFWQSMPWKNISKLLGLRQVQPVAAGTSSPHQGFRPLLDSPAQSYSAGAEVRLYPRFDRESTNGQIIPPAPEFFVTEASRENSDCCIVINGVVKNFGDASGTCDVTVLGYTGYLRTDLAHQRATITSPYRIEPGESARFSASLYHAWADEWRVEVRSPKTDSLGKPWTKTMTKTVD